MYSFWPVQEISRYREFPSHQAIYNRPTNFDVLLTVHLSIMLATDQLNAQIYFHDKFLISLYMFRALLCSSSGGQIVLYRSGIVTLCRWPSGAQVAHRTATRCCIIQFDLLMMSTTVL